VRGSSAIALVDEPLAQSNSQAHAA
jgi:hypothetical protein